MKRSTAIDLIRFAGYHGDRESFTRLYVENRVSYVAAKDAYSKGVDLRQRGVRCGCAECDKAVTL